MTIVDHGPRPLKMFDPDLVELLITRGTRRESRCCLDPRLANDEALQVVDVKSAREFANTHVPEAVNIPLARLRGRAGEPDPTIPAVTYCNRGVSGNVGQTVPLRLGFTNVYALSRGNNNYQSQQRPIA